MITRGGETGVSIDTDGPTGMAEKKVGFENSGPRVVAASAGGVGAMKQNAGNFATVGGVEGGPAADCGLINGLNGIKGGAEWTLVVSIGGTAVALLKEKLNAGCGAVVSGKLGDGAAGFFAAGKLKEGVVGIGLKGDFRDVRSVGARALAPLTRTPDLPLTTFTNEILPLFSVTILQRLV